MKEIAVMTVCLFLVCNAASWVIAFRRPQRFYFIVAVSFLAALSISVPIMLGADSDSRGMMAGLVRIAIVSIITPPVIAGVRGIQQPEGIWPRRAMCLLTFLSVPLCGIAIAMVILTPLAFLLVDSPLATANGIHLFAMGMIVNTILMASAAPVAWLAYCCHSRRTGVILLLSILALDLIPFVFLLATELFTDSLFFL